MTNGYHDDLHYDEEGSIILPAMEADEETVALLASMTQAEHEKYERQELFLQGVAERGTITWGARRAGIGERTFHRWRDADLFGFCARYRDAKRRHVDYYEHMVEDRLDNPTGNRGSDVLLIAKMNKEDPDNWRGNNVTVEAGDEIMKMMIKLQQEAEEIRTARLQAPVVEGSSRVLEPIDLDKYQHPGE